MANKAYPKGKVHLVTGVNLSTDDIKVVLVDLADYTYSEAHEFLSDVIVGARVATSPNLSGKTLTVTADAGDDYVVFDADPTTFSAVTGDPSEAYIVYKDTGVAATSPLLFFVDTDASSNPISITPNGGDINLAFSDPLGIAKIG